MQAAAPDSALWHRGRVSFPLDGATDSEESRQLVAAAKETALRDMQMHLHFVVEWDWFGRSDDWPGYHEVLHRITGAEGPKAQEATGPAGAEV